MPGGSIGDSARGSPSRSEPGRNLDHHEYGQQNEGHEQPALVAGAWSFMKAFADANELQDDQLRQIAALGDVVLDVDMTPPRLEELYRHYSQEEAQ